MAQQELLKQVDAKTYAENKSLGINVIGEVAEGQFKLEGYRTSAKGNVYAVCSPTTGGKQIGIALGELGESICTNPKAIGSIFTYSRSKEGTASLTPSATMQKLLGKAA